MSKFLFTVSGQSNAGLIYPYLKAALIAKYGDDNRFALSAQGDTAISEFQRGKTLYTNLIDQVVAAQSAGYTWAKMFFWQGEADTRPGLPELWEDDFVKMVYDLRIDSAAFPQVVFFKLGQPPHPDDTEHTKLWYELCFYQQGTQNDHPGYVLVPTADTPNYPAGIPHRSVASYKILASRALELSTKGTQQ